MITHRRHCPYLQTVGVAFADVSLCKMFVAEFPDNDQFSNFEARPARGAADCAGPDCPDWRQRVCAGR